MIREGTESRTKETRMKEEYSPDITGRDRFSVAGRIILQRLLTKLCSEINCLREGILEFCQYGE
jgi:hypothetical protein